MNILIFGASGATGRQLVKQALLAGHEVTAFVRNPLKLKIQHQNLHVITGNVINYEQVEEAVRGHDAILSALGASSPFTYDAAVVTGFQHIIQAMESTGVIRLVYMSTAGIKESRQHAGFIMKHLAPKLLATEIRGHEEREDLIRQSPLQWTIVRPTTLTNGRHTRQFTAGENIRATGFVATISRADVADLMLAELNNNAFVHKAPLIMY